MLATGRQMHLSPQDLICEIIAGRPSIPVPTFPPLTKSSSLAIVVSCAAYHI